MRSDDDADGESSLAATFPISEEADSAQGSVKDATVTETTQDCVKVLCPECNDTGLLNHREVFGYADACEIALAGWKEGGPRCSALSGRAPVEIPCEACLRCGLCGLRCSEHTDRELRSCVSEFYAYGADALLSAPGRSLQFLVPTAAGWIEATAELEKPWLDPLSTEWERSR